MVFCVASMASREASRLNFARLPDALLGALHYGVYPWRVLRPRSTKPAATVLICRSTASEDVRCAYALIYLRPACRKTDRKTSRGPPQRSTRRLQEQPAFYLWENFEEFWAACFK